MEVSWIPSWRGTTLLVWAMLWWHVDSKPTALRRSLLQDGFNKDYDEDDKEDTLANSLSEDDDDDGDDNQAILLSTLLGFTLALALVWFLYLCRRRKVTGRDHQVPPQRFPEGVPESMLQVGSKNYGGSDIDGKVSGGEFEPIDSARSRMKYRRFSQTGGTDVSLFGGVNPIVWTDSVFPTAMPSKLIVGVELGSGPWSQVYTAEFQQLSFAVKFIDLEHVDYYVSGFERTGDLNHPCLMKTFGYYEDGERRSLLAPLYQNNLKTWFAKSQPVSAWRKCVQSLLEALAYLHEHKLCHGRLKPENVLVSNFGTIVLSDYCLESDGRVKHLDYHQCRYTAPEVIQSPDGDLTPESDVWSFGVCIIQVIAQKDPYAHIEEFENTRVLSDDYLKQRLCGRFTSNSLDDPECRPFDLSPEDLQTQAPHTLLQLLFRCLEREKLARPTLSQLLEVFSNDSNFIQQISPAPSFSAGQQSAIRPNLAGVRPGFESVPPQGVDGDFSEGLAAFNLVEILGRGNFGTCHTAMRKKDSKFGVLKEVKCTSSEMDGAKQEGIMLKTMQHPNIVEYYDCFVDKGALYIFMEYADGGTLHDLIYEEDLLPEEVVLAVFVETLLALQHIHRKKVLHRDIKPGNIFLKKESANTVKLGDFGIAKQMNSTNSFAQTVVGTPYYLAPELCKGEAYGPKADVWALGCIVYEMCQKKRPFQGENLMMLVRRIVEGAFDPLPPQYSEELNDIVYATLEVDVSNRPSVDELLLLPIVRQYLASVQLTESASLPAETGPDGMNPVEMVVNDGTEDKDWEPTDPESTMNEQPRGESPFGQEVLESSPQQQQLVRSTQNLSVNHRSLSGTMRSSSTTLSTEGLDLHQTRSSLSPSPSASRRLLPDKVPPSRSSSGVVSSQSSQEGSLIAQTQVLSSCPAKLGEDGQVANNAVTHDPMTFSSLPTGKRAVKEARRRSVAFGEGKNLAMMNRLVKQYFSRVGSPNYPTFDSGNFKCVDMSVMMKRRRRSANDTLMGERSISLEPVAERLVEDEFSLSRVASTPVGPAPDNVRLSDVLSASMGPTTREDLESGESNVSKTLPADTQEAITTPIEQQAPVDVLAQTSTLPKNPPSTSSPLVQSEGSATKARRRERRRHRQRPPQSPPAVEQNGGTHVETNDADPKAPSPLVEEPKQAVPAAKPTSGQTRHPLRQNAGHTDVVVDPSVLNGTALLNKDTSFKHLALEHSVPVVVSVSNDVDPTESVSAATISSTPSAVTASVSSAPSDGTSSLGSTLKLTRQEQRALARARKRAWGGQQATAGRAGTATPCGASLNKPIPLAQAPSTTDSSSSQQVSCAADLVVSDIGRPTHQSVQDPSPPLSPIPAGTSSLSSNGPTPTAFGI